MKSNDGNSIGRRALNAFLAFVLAAGTMMTYWSCAELPQANADPGETEYTQVDNTYFFNTGWYMNSFDHMQDPPFTKSSFETSGGYMKELEPSLQWTPERDIYNECQIWPSLLGHDSSMPTEGWAFITDETWEDAEGAWFSVLWTEAGTLHDASNTDQDDEGILVDIKTTYTITGAADSTHLQSYRDQGWNTFDGHLAIQIGNNFSYGTFQFGVMDMQTTYEFFDHATGEPIRADNIYYTKTSMDKGETLAVEPDMIVKGLDDPGIFVSSGAPKTVGNPLLASEYQFNVIDGTRLYNGAHHEDFVGMVAFAGAPWVNPADQFDYVDSVDAWNYYWRSVCMRLNMDGGNQLTVHHGSVGWSNWTDAFDIPDPTYWDNGGTMYTTHNFLPSTNVLPNDPEKYINGQQDPITDVKIGDIINYSVVQDVINLGHDGLTRYQSFEFVDELPKYVEYVEGSAKLIDPYGNPLQADAGAVTYDKTSNKLTYAFAHDYLQNEMILDGGEYTLEFDVKVVDQPTDDLETVKNDCDVIINGHIGTSNVVEYEPVKPELDIEKHAVLDYKLASSINEYEYLNHDENPDDYSTVHYEGYMQNITDGTRAKNVTVYDKLAPGIKLIPDSLKVTGADGIQVVKADEDGWEVLVPDLQPWTQISFEYDCYTTTEGNGLEVVNTAKTWCTNAELGTDGAEDNHAYDDGEIYINDPNLVVKKTVSESPVQNEDYQQGEEYRVGDEFTYSVVLENTVPGTIAKNVRLTDDDLPAGFELVGNVQVDGLELNGAGYKIPYPISGESDSVHGEEETRTIEYSFQNLAKEDGTWGWNLDINYLDYNRPVTVTWTVKATDSMNGYEVYNRARATADNQPNDVFMSTDGRTGEDYTIVWINSPEYRIDKQVRKTDQAYQVGDVAAYDIVVSDLADPGTLARDTVLSDVFEQEGTTIIEDSFVITDQPEEDRPQNIVDQVELNRWVGRQGYDIDFTQVYPDSPNGYWVNSEDWRPIFKDGVERHVEGEHNPVLTYPEYDKEDCESDAVERAHDYFKIHYEATINDMALQNEQIDNIAEINGREDIPADDNAQVTVTGAQLMIDKDCNLGTEFTPGDVAEYELTITNNATGTVAENVQISDRFSTKEAGTVAIVQGSVEVYDNQGTRLLIPDGAVTYMTNEAGDAYGFTIDTGYDLPSSQKLTVRYDVKYLSNNGGQSIDNVAKTWADNAPEVQDEHSTWPSDMDQSDLRIVKGSNDVEYQGGEYGTYTLNVSNNSDQTALNVTVHDELDPACTGIARIVKGSVTLYNNLGETVAWDRIVYNESGGVIRGFTVYTDIDLAPGENLRIVYQVGFSEVAQNSPVHNEAWAAADNTGTANDENDVVVKPGTPDQPGGGEGDEGDPSLSIVKDSNKSWYAPGETGRYTLLVTNTEQGTTAHSVVVSDQLAPNVVDHASIVEGSVQVVNAMGQPVSVESVYYERDADGAANGFTVETGYDLSYGDNLTVTYDVQFSNLVSGTTSIRNTANADSDDTPSVKDDHEVNLDTESHPELDVDKQVKVGNGKFADSAVAGRGDTLTYRVNVSESAEGAVAESVVLTDTLPDGFVLDQDSVRVEKDGHQQTATVEFPAGKVRVSLGDVAYGEQWTVEYSGKVADDFLGDELKNVVVAESPTVPDKPGDETVTELDSPKLVIEKVAGADSVQPGDDLSWTISVHQANPDAVATDVVVTDKIPEGFELDKSGVTVTDGYGKDYRANVDLTNGLLTVSLGDLAYGTTVVINLDGIVAGNFEGDSIANTAVVDAENVPDPVEDEDEVTVAETPELSIVKTADMQGTEPGGTVNYRLTVNQLNEGAVATNAVVTDSIPDGMTVSLDSVHVTVGGNPMNAPIAIEDNALTVQLGDVQYGDVYEIFYTGTVDEDYTGATLDNTAVVTSDNDPEGDEDTWTVTTDGVKPFQGITVDKAVDQEEIVAGEAAHYTVTAIVGTVSMKNVVLTDELPAGLSLDQSSLEIYVNDELTSVQVTLENNVLTMPMGDLSANATVRVEYDCYLDSDAEGDSGALTNVVTATADGIDPVSAEATVNYDFGPGGNPGNPLKGLDQTGDAILGFLAGNWPFVLAAVVALGAAAAWLVLGGKRKEDAGKEE